MKPKSITIRINPERYKEEADLLILLDAYIRRRRCSEASAVKELALFAIGGIGAVGVGSDQVLDAITFAKGYADSRKAVSEG